MIGYCNLAVVPCRKEPSDKSEMVTQLLFGESFDILEERESWTLIRVHYDGYESWIGNKQYITEKSDKPHPENQIAISTDLLQIAQTESGEIIPLTLGSSLPGIKNNTFKLGKVKYSFEGEFTHPFTKKKNSLDVLSVARWYLNAPYLWGGRSLFGIDCSGFTQMVMKFGGIKLLRDAWQQAEQGTPIAFIEETIPGDLAFFDNEDGKITHVGMILNSDSNLPGQFHIIHASGKVRIDRLDHHGIFNAELNKYTHRLRVIKRFGN